MLSDGQSSSLHPHPFLESFRRYYFCSKGLPPSLFLGKDSKESSLSLRGEERKKFQVADIKERERERETGETQTSKSCWYATTKGGMQNGAQLEYTCTMHTRFCMLSTNLYA